MKQLELPFSKIDTCKLIALHFNSVIDNNQKPVKIAGKQALSGSLDNKPSFSSKPKLRQLLLNGLADDLGAVNV